MRKIAWTVLVVGALVIFIGALLPTGDLGGPNDKMAVNVLLTGGGIAITGVCLLYSADKFHRRRREL